MPFGNAAARCFYMLLKGLVEQGHRVTVFAACSKREDVQEAARLLPRPQYDVRCFGFPARGGLRAKWETLRRPYSYMFSSELRRQLQAELACGYDVLHLEQLSSGWLGTDHIDRSLVNVYHLHSIDLAGVPRTSGRQRLDYALMRRAERRLIGDFTFFRCVSQRLMDAVCSKNASAQGGFVPVSLDFEAYRYVPDEARPVAPTVVLIGQMGWYPSYSAAVRLLTRLWPHIRREVPEARLQIVGWAARRKLAAHVGEPAVEILEDVDSAARFFERAGVFVYAPLRGSGAKIKILEAMAYGVPVVTTPEGVEGLPARDDVHAGLAEDDQGLISRTVSLLKNREKQNAQRRAARALLEAHCSPERTVQGIEHLYGLILDHHQKIRVPMRHTAGLLRP